MIELALELLKQGLQEGGWEERLRWWRPQVHTTVSGWRRGRRRMRTRQGKMIKVDVNMVTLRIFRSHLKYGAGTTGVKSERGSQKMPAAMAVRLWRMQMFAPTEIRMKIASGTME